MLERAKIYLLWSLGLGLPWHGAITVFGPDWLRWWKEGILILLLLAVIPNLIWDPFPKLKALDSCLHRNDKRRILLNPLLWAFLFLVWGGVLVLINYDFNTALVALRYLGLGLFAWMLGYGVWKTTLSSGKNGYGKATKLFHTFCTALSLGVLTATVFGLWAKFGGGYAVLASWYSNTISSWVPGQVIPLYHEAAGGFVRLQGASSGPIEYSHLALLALWYAVFFRSRFIGRNWYRLAAWGTAVLLLFFGIGQSGSRAAVLGALILIVLALWQHYRSHKPARPMVWTADKWAATLLVIIALVVMVKFTLAKAILGDIEILNKNIVRISDVDHLTRPLEALNIAAESPWIGSLGELGPAARAKNLAQHNNDQAPIAESVPIDILAQLGLPGLLLWLAFLFTYWQRAATQLRYLLIIFTPLMLLATIFDMTPLSLSFYLSLALGLALPQLRRTNIDDFALVFELKKRAFRTYVEQVWGWQEAEQKRFLRQELDLGNIQLVQHDGVLVATFALERGEHYHQLFSFYVHPAEQSRGFGAVILNDILPRYPLHLEVLKVNSRAKAFYLKHGFVETGENQHHFMLQRL